MKKLIEVGRNVSVVGRFIPESRMEEISKNIINQNYPPIDMHGKIECIINSEMCSVEFNDFTMEIRNSDLSFSKSDYEKFK